MTKIPAATEWLETDGLGGFASGTVGLLRTRRYHGLLVAARRPPVDRFVLVNGLEVCCRTLDGPKPLSAQFYSQNVTVPESGSPAESCTLEPWPRWTFRLGPRTTIDFEVFVPKGIAAVVCRWRLSGPAAQAELKVRPLMSGRDFHHTHSLNPHFRFAAVEDTPARVTWRPYDSLPYVHAWHNGIYTHAADWYYNFCYTQERERGLDDCEDLASPGIFCWNLKQSEAVLVFEASEPRDGWHTSLPHQSVNRSQDALPTVSETVALLSESEFRRRTEDSLRLKRSSRHYFVDRDQQQSIIAGYPWFSDWGRDTFIALRGFCFAVGQWEIAVQVLSAWGRAIDRGMIPNRFPDQDAAPEYHAADASLWFVMAVHRCLSEAAGGRLSLDESTTDELQSYADAILTAYRDGTRYGIGIDREDGLLRAGQDNDSLTWMDARFNGFAVTPRVGKPVELQALWLNALRTSPDFKAKWKPLFKIGRASLRDRFWNPKRNCLFDVIDADNGSGRLDHSLRPNQIFTVGGLPYSLFDDDHARRIVDTVEDHLWTPYGLRTLSPQDPGYCGTYAGDPASRDAAYHQGTVWPWLLGGFVDAWVKVRGNTSGARQAARQRFLPSLHRHLDTAGFGHISEIFDGDAPHAPRGCPFQAWSLSELMWLECDMLSDGIPESVTKTKRRKAH